MKENRETVADIVIFPVAQIGKCLKWELTNYLVLDQNWHNMYHGYI